MSVRDDSSSYTCVLIEAATVPPLQNSTPVIAFIIDPPSVKEGLRRRAVERISHIGRGVCIIERRGRWVVGVCWSLYSKRFDPQLEHPRRVRYVFWLVRQRSIQWGTLEGDSTGGPNHWIAALSGRVSHISGRG